MNEQLKAEIERRVNEALIEGIERDIAEPPALRYVSGGPTRTASEIAAAAAIVIGAMTLIGLVLFWGVL